MRRRWRAQLGAPHIELDALHWEPSWVMAELDVFRERVGRAVAAERWVVDGNYSKARDLVWTRADTLVWLDYPFALTFMRLLRRTLRRVSSGQELWNGNRERFAEQFLSRDSLFLWAIKAHARYRDTFPALFVTDPCSHLQIVRLRTPRASKAWLQQIHRTEWQEM